MRLARKEPVVAGMYFNPQASAPFPTVHALMPIRNKRIHMGRDRERAAFTLPVINGNKITNKIPQTLIAVIGRKVKAGLTQKDRSVCGLVLHFTYDVYHKCRR
jgi:hypothetical protein